MLELMYITNNPVIAQIVDEAGVERVWIDLEKLGKEERQKNRDSVKSEHKLSDIRKIKPLLKKAKLQVRINPIHVDSKKEIIAAINNGADIIMLPYYKTVNEVEIFVKLVAGKAKTVLLLETKEANECLDKTLLIPGIDEIHIGLNDLHLSYGLTFMFELLVDGTVEAICKKIQNAGKPYGFGGISKLGGGMIPAEKIISEHYRLGSTRAILSRSFCNADLYEDPFEVREIFNIELNKLRQYEKSLRNKDFDFFQENKKNTKSAVQDIVANIEKGKK